MTGIKAASLTLIILLSYFSIIISSSQVTSMPNTIKCNNIIYANIVKIEGDKLQNTYEKITDNNLVIDPGEASLLLVRVTSSAPLKPFKVYVNNIEIIPRLSDGIIIVGDVVKINFTKLGFRGTVRILFREDVSRPSVYALNVEESYIEIRKEVNITLGEDVWGTLLIIISYEDIDVSRLLDAKYTILTHTLRNITTEVGIIHEHKWKILITSQYFSIRKFSSKIIKMVYKRIFLNKVSLINIGSNILRIKTNIENSSIYLNPPFEYNINSIIGNYSFHSFLSQIFNFYFPRIFDAQEIELNIKSVFSHIKVIYPNGTLYRQQVYVDDGLNKKIITNGEILLLSNFINGNITITFLLGSENIGCYKIYGISSNIEVKAPLYRVIITIEDLKGRKVLNATLEVYRSFTKKIYNVSEGILDLGYIPHGRYIFRVRKNGIEIGRKIIEISNDAQINIECNLMNIKYQIFKVNGEKVKNYTFHIEGMGLSKNFTTTTGTIYIYQVIPGEYRYSVILNERRILEKKCKIYPSNSSIIDVIDLPNLQIKIMNFFGNPIKGIEVNLLSENYTLIYSGKTNEYGKMVFRYLNKSFYTIEIPSLSYKRTLKLENDENITIRTNIIFIFNGFMVKFNDILYIFICLIVLVLAYVLFKNLKSRKNEIILDIEDGAKLHEYLVEK